MRNGAANVNGITLNNANNEIYDNEIYNNGGKGIALNPNYNTNYNGIIKVYRNKIYDNSNYGIIIGGADTNRHARIYNNLMWDNTNYAVNILDSSSANEIYSNSIYMSAGHGIIIQGSPSGNTMKDNAIWVNTGYTIRDNSGDIVENHNCLYTGGFSTVIWNTNSYSDIATYRTDSGQGTNSMWQDCLFINPSNGDFRLQSSSPAIDTGADLSAFFTTDKDGVPRPQGSAWDIGAYEYIP